MNTVDRLYWYNSDYSEYIDLIEGEGGLYHGDNLKVSRNPICYWSVPMYTRNKLIQKSMFAY